MVRLAQCRLVSLPKFTDTRGSLSFVETGRQIDFSVRRIYFLYDMPPDVSRGAHAHKALQQLILPLSGSFDVELDDGCDKACYHLDSPATGLYVCPGVWRDLRHFAPQSVCLVLASQGYDENDYIRDYQEFLRWVAQP